MKKGIHLKDILKAELKKPEVKKAFDEEDTFANVAIQVARLREKNGLTQKQLAELIHTKQQAVSRIESLSYHGYTLSTLVRIAQAMRKRVSVSFV
jgi:ribosome-binding protein aMBF1 (putative translation factor)